MLYILFFKNTASITIQTRVVNIHNHNAITRGNIHDDFHTASNNKNILHAKLQGANQAKKAINKLVF